MKEQYYLKMFKEIRSLNDTPEDYLKFKETIMDTTKTDRKIALFMGGEYTSKDKTFINIPGIGIKYVGSLKYHSDWNWLMPVVEKIGDITSEHDTQFAGLAIFELGLMASFDTVYNAVIQFIDWYTLNPQHNEQ